MTTTPTITPAAAFAAVSRRLGVPRADMRKDLRSAQVLCAKRVAVLVLRQIGMSQQKVSEALSCDKTTVQHREEHATDRERELAGEILEQLRKGQGDGVGGGAEQC